MMAPMIPHLLTPDEARVATAAGLGSFVFLMLTRQMGWLHVLTLFIIGQITAYYFTMPVAVWRGWSPSSYGTIGFTIGLLGMLFWGAVLQLAQNLRDDPKEMLSWLRRLWKGDDRYRDRSNRDLDDGDVA
jgi:hypothetical protein